MIVICEKSLALWFFPVRLADRRGDLLGYAEREGAGTRAIYRHRWYADGEDQDPFNGRDAKKWVEMVTKDAPEIAIPKLAEAFDLMADAARVPKDERCFLRRGTLSADQFLDVVLQQPFMHRRFVPTPSPGHA